ncbi:MAG TPA: HIT family protein [Bacillota bacterium]|nr:HIT family protein [Bacillota bacterium]
MSIHSNCFYCSKSERLGELMIEICQLGVSTVYLFRDQSYRGRCIVQYRDHKTELFHLTDEERDAFFSDVSTVASALYQTFSPDKLNYAIFGDNVPHLHINVIPKFQNGPCWGKAFGSDPSVAKVFLTESEYQEMTAAIKANMSR